MVLNSVSSSSFLRPAACTIPLLIEHLPFFLHFPHHSYFTIQSAFPFSFSPLPIYLDKNPYHKRESKRPLMTTWHIMPPKKTKNCVLIADGSRTAPPPASAHQHHPPPPILNKETMSSNDYSLAMSLNTAPYPLFGCHPSKPTKALARAYIGDGKQKGKQSPLAPVRLGE
jgi:hypothetical protein